MGKDQDAGIRGTSAKRDCVETILTCFCDRENGDKPTNLLSMPLVPFNALPSTARVWVFGSDVPVTGAAADTLLAEVDQWTSLGDRFLHLRTQAPPKNRQALLTAILADGINLGLTRMSEACRETTWRQLSWTADWHVREECYAQALACLIDAQHRQPLAAHWGSGTTSSSDAQFFRAGARGEVGGLVNLHYGQDPGVKFYTHLSDQFGPFHTKVIAATANEAPYVLDGLLYHQSSLVINEHYTDTGGFSDHVFAMCRLLGFRFAPRIRDLKEKRLYVLPGMTVLPTTTTW
jgi:hypothetical protein